MDSDPNPTATNEIFIKRSNKYPDGIPIELLDPDRIEPPPEPEESEPEESVE